MIRLGFIIVILITTINAFGGELRGRLICDEKPVAYANVILMNDTTFVAGNISDENGVFQLTDTTSTFTHIEITALGYDTQKLPVKEYCDLGDISLTQKSYTLNEVEVKGSLPTTQLKGSVLVTNVANTVLSNIGTANDVLTQIPSVINQNGDYTVFGKGTPLIYINGRLVRNKIELDQLSSKDIKSVEVNGNPGAKYDASVNAVIRITTKRKNWMGWGINLRTSNRYDNAYMNTEQVDVIWRNDKLELLAMAYVNAGKSKNEIEASQTTYSDNIWGQTMSDKNSSSKLKLSGKIGVNYQLNKSNSFGFYYKNGYNRSHDKAHLNSVVAIDGVPHDHWVSDGKGKTHETPNHSMNAYYNGAIRNVAIDFNMDYMKLNSYSNLFQDEVSESYDSKAIETYNKGKNQLFAEKLAITAPLKNGQIEFGEEYTNSIIESLSDYSDTNESLNSFGKNKITESNIGVFAEVAQTFGPVNLSYGLRYEHVKYKYQIDNNIGTNQDKSFNNLFPSLSVSGNLQNVQLAFSFTGKTRRPGYKQMDGNINYINRITLSKGNPFLTAEKLYNADMMMMWKFLFAKIGYQYVADPIFYTTDAYKSDPAIKVISYKNASDYQSVQLFVGAQPQLGCWQPQINFGIEKQWVNTHHQGEYISQNKPIVMVQMRNSITLPYEIYVNADLSYIGKGNRQNVLVKESSSVDLSIRKTFFNRSLTIQAQCMDLFNKSRNNIVFYGGDVCFSEKNVSNNRTFMLTLRYRFNVTKSKYKGSGAGESEKERF